MSENNLRAKWLRSILVASILSLGASLRIIGLTTLPNGLHWDEQDTGYQAYSLLQTGRDYFGNILPLFPHSLAKYRTPVLIYSTVPVVKFFGLSAFSVRLLPAIFGILGIITFGMLCYFTSRDLTFGILGLLIISLSIWHIQYSRQTVESIVMSLYFLLGLTCFFRKKYIVSALLFGLSMWAYSTAKMFVPVFVLFLFLSNLKNFKRLPLLSIFIFSLLSIMVITDGVFGKSGQRFRELSIMTDPTTAAEVNVLRQTQQLASGATGVGLSPRPIDKIIYNKPMLWWGTFIRNYASAYSTEFLFISGDHELRHSPSKENIGMLYLIEVIPLGLGIYIALKNKNYWLIFWFLFGAVPGALTRTDNPHAARLFIMLPALLYLISLGMKFVYDKSRPLLYFYTFILLYSSFITLSYYFSVYRWESAKPFQYGFDKIIETIELNKNKYDRIMVDGKQDTLLMAYLFNTAFDPAKFQSMLPLPVVQPYSNVYGNQFDNVFLLSGGERTWRTIWNDGETRQKTLLIVATGQPELEIDKSLPSGISGLGTIDYPDSSIAFQIIEAR